MKPTVSALSAFLLTAACARQSEVPPADQKASLASPASASKQPVPRQTLPEQAAQQRATEDSPAAIPAHASGASVPTIFAIGDLHGDLVATRRALRLAGAIDEQDHWSGGRNIVVQTGDVLDRGDDDRAILELLDGLRAEASAAGGAFIALSGNHEIMNVAHDFRYVTPGALAAFGGEEGREHAFHPGQSFAMLLANWPVTAEVAGTVFVHGGVLEKHARYGLSRINHEVAAYMRGERPAPPDIVVASDGPVWTRLYSSSPDAEACAELTRALHYLGAKRMVVGHTPQGQGISAACDGKVWRIDVGMSHAYGGPVQVLVIDGDHVEVRSLAKGTPG